MDNRVKVGVRIRPLINNEVANGSANAVDIDPTRSTAVRVNVPARKNTYDYDWVFGPNISQKELYQQLCGSLISKVFEGVNATVFCYGQTGSGKTFTMGNPAVVTQDEGIIGQSMTDIFHRRDEMLDAGTGATTIELSYVEVYKEEVFDLLATRGNTASNEKVRLDIRETTKGTIIEGLTSKAVTSIEEVSKYLSEAAVNRSVGGTAMNAHSSRSHAICTLSLRVVHPSTHEGGVDEVLVSKLHLVDLAGSERAKKTQATGDTFAEGVSINKSLFALGNVVAALADGGGQGYIPYRDSKLTRLLQDALGGNGLTVMLACISPADSNVEETLSTLSFASRASSIVNTVHVNHDDNNLDYVAMKKEVDHLRQQVSLLQTKCNLLSTASSSTAMTTSSYHNNIIQEVVVVDHDQLLVEVIETLTSSLKQILVTCLQEGTILEENDINAIQINISKIYDEIKVHSAVNHDDHDEVSESMNIMDDDFMPPIILLIDKLNSFQKLLNSSSSSSADVSTSSDDNMATSHESAIHRIVAQEHRVEEGIHHKQLEIAQILDLTEKFESTITQLKSEIESLEKDKNSLMQRQKQQQASKSSSGHNNMSSSQSVVVNNEDIKIKRELKEKSRQLEEKLKELRFKESEYSRVTQQKEILSKEAEVLRKDLEVSTKKRGDLLRKMKEEGSSHLAEKTKLQHAEVQSKRRELQAQHQLQELKNAYGSKERVLRSQIEAKDRENKQLKELIDKQAKVKSMKNINSGPVLQNNYVSATSNTTGVNVDVTEARSKELRLWLNQEIDSQANRAMLHDDIQRQIEIRTKTAKRLQDLKSTRGDEVSAAGEIKALEEEIRSRSIKISQKHGQLADLGSVIEKKRFGKLVQDPKEAKAVMDIMFDKLSKDSSLQKRGFENKIKAQEKQIDNLKKCLTNYGHSVDNTSTSTMTSTHHVSASNKRKLTDNDINYDDSILDTSISLNIEKNSEIPKAKPRRNSVLTTGPSASVLGRAAFGSKPMNRLPLRVISTVSQNPPNKKIRVSLDDNSYTKSTSSSKISSSSSTSSWKPVLSSIQKKTSSSNMMMPKSSTATLPSNNHDTITESSNMLPTPHIIMPIDEVDVDNHDEDENEMEFNESYEEEDVEEESYEEDESFRPDEESFDDDDDDNGYHHHKSRKNPHHTWKGSKEVMQSWKIRPSDDSFSSHDSESHPNDTWHRNSGQSSSHDSDSSRDSIIMHDQDDDMTRYTVKELKAMLASRNLPVSGVKDVLIQRLREYNNINMMPQDDHNHSHDASISQNSSAVDMNISMDDDMVVMDVGAGHHHHDENQAPQHHQHDHNKSIDDVVDGVVKSNAVEKKRKLNSNRKMMFGTVVDLLNEIDETMQGM